MRLAVYWGLAAAGFASLAVVLAFVFGGDSQAWRYVAALGLVCLQTGLLYALLAWFEKRCRQVFAEFKDAVGQLIRDGGECR